MDLRTWIAADLESLRNRLANGIFAAVPSERLVERADNGGIAGLYMVWHTARHHDLAVNGVLRSVPEVLEQWSERVGVREDSWRGLAEAEDLDLLPLLKPQAVVDYFLAVIDETRAWLANGDLRVLDTVPDSLAVLEQIGTPRDRFDWLYGMWEAKPASFYLSWEAVGHGYNHLGELTAFRNRLGLSPF